MKRLFTLALAVAFSLSIVAPALADDQEQQIGQQVYQQLQQKGEIITSSPYYKILNPIAARIAAVANPQYDAPFHFILVHESSPNAFAVPGGNVYVTDSMMTFAKNKEELAGVLCHETSHTIHHDVMSLSRKQQNVDLVAGILSSVLGGGQVTNMILGTADQLVGARFSRTVEGQADHKGAQTCAQAGINPWGMVWLFKQFEAAPTSKPPEALSDHPTDEHRVADLENEFAASPALFGKYSDNVATATPLDAPGFRSDVRTQAYRQSAKQTRKYVRSNKTKKAAKPYCCGG